MIFGTFLTITEANMTTLVGHMSDLFTDLSPLILLIVGVGIALLVVGFLIRAFR